MIRFLYIIYAIFFLYYGNLKSQTTTVNFNFTGAAQSWTVPPCVNSINVNVQGAEGGGGSTANNGAIVTATIAVTPGQILQINVGGQGTQPGVGWNGGGAGANATGAGNTSFGGGGASDIRIGPPYTLANRIVVASGGGGTGGGDTDGPGGAGGCDTGTAGTSPFGQGGGGASQTAGGAAGPPWIASGNWGTAGGLGIGGTGASDPCYNVGPGGGGGGGYYGGGGGGSDCWDSAPLGGGGGGGGSSLVPAGGGCSSGTSTGAGFVSITYTATIPTVTVNNVTICAGQSATLTATPSITGGTYLWNTGATTQSITVTPASTTSYSVVYTLNGCQSLSVSGTVTVISQNTIAAGTSQTVCINTAIATIINDLYKCG